MAESTSKSSSTTSSSSATTTSTERMSGTTFSSSSSTAAPNTELIRPYTMSSTDCAALFSGEEAWDALDLYFIDRCNPSNRLLIKAEHYTDAGVKFSFKYTGDTNTSGSPSDEYYVIKNAMVDVEFTLRNGLNIPDIKSFIMMGDVTETAEMRVHTMKRSNTIRHRPPNYILIAVPEGENPAPDNPEIGGYLFPNVTFDLQTGLTLTHNAKDFIDVPVKFVAKFAKGKEGVLSQVFVPRK